MYAVYRRFVWSEPKGAKKIDSVALASTSRAGWMQCTVTKVLYIDKPDRAKLVVTNRYGEEFAHVFPLAKLTYYFPAAAKSSDLYRLSGTRCEVQLGNSPGWSIERLVSGAFELVVWPGPERTGKLGKTYSEVLRDASGTKSVFGITGWRGSIFHPKTETTSSSR